MSYLHKHRRKKLLEKLQPLQREAAFLDAKKVKLAKKMIKIWQELIDIDNWERKP